MQRPQPLQNSGRRKGLGRSLRAVGMPGTSSVKLPARRVRRYAANESGTFGPGRSETRASAPSVLVAPHNHLLPADHRAAESAHDRLGDLLRHLHEREPLGDPDRRAGLARAGGRMTDSAIFSGTSTSENRSAIWIEPTSRGLTLASLTMAPTRSPGRTPAARPAPAQILAELPGSL